MVTCRHGAASSIGVPWYDSDVVPRACKAAPLTWMQGKWLKRRKGAPLTHNARAREASLTHAHAYSSLVRRLRAVRAGICTRASPQTNPLPPTNPSLFFYQRFREFQHVAVVRVSLVQLDGRELGVVPRAQAFVAPNPPQLKHFFKPAHHLFRILARARPAAAAARAPAQRGVRTKLRTRASKQTNTN